MVEYTRLYGVAFENLVAKWLKGMGYLVVQSIYPEYKNIDGKEDTESQIDIVAFNVKENTIYVIEVKSWDSVQWVDCDLMETNWVYKSRSGNTYEKFNPFMQCKAQLDTLQIVMDGLKGTGYNLNERVFFKYPPPISGWSLSFQKGMVLSGGVKSDRNVLDIYDWLKQNEDFSERKRIEHLNRLDNDKYTRGGAYSYNWKEIVKNLKSGSK